MKKSYIGHRKRLKERFLNGNVETLPEYEMLELILFMAHPRKNQKELAKAILHKFKNLSNVIDASYQELSQVEGVTDSVLISIGILKTSFEKIIRQSNNKIPHTYTFLVWEQLLDYARLSIYNMNKNEFKILLLNEKNILKSEINVTLEKIMESPRSIIKKTLNSNCKAIVFINKTLNKKTEPSLEEIKITKKIIDMITPVGIKLLDHIIINKQGYYSFKQSKLL